VLEEGEAVPTIKSIRRDSGPNLLSAAKGSVVRVAKMRKGQVFFHESCSESCTECCWQIACCWQIETGRYKLLS